MKKSHHLFIIYSFIFLRFSNLPSLVWFRWAFQNGHSLSIASRRVSIFSKGWTRRINLNFSIANRSFSIVVMCLGSERGGHLQAPFWSSLDDLHVDVNVVMELYRNHSSGHASWWVVTANGHCASCLDSIASFILWKVLVHPRRGGRGTPTEASSAVLSSNGPTSRGNARLLIITRQKVWRPSRSFGSHRGHTDEGGLGHKRISFKPIPVSDRRPADIVQWTPMIQCNSRFNSFFE